MQKKLRISSAVFLLPVFCMMALGTLFTEVYFLSINPNLLTNNTKNKSHKILSDVRVAQAANGNEMSIDGRAITDDARPLIIKRYLEKYNSPLVPYSDLIFELSQTYGYEYYWIVAIAQQESNLCKKAPEGTYNCWGYGIHKKGTLGFDSYELALRSYAEYLKRVYFDKGLNTPELIMKKYCPSSNGSWAKGVTQFINELEGGNF